LEVAKSRDVRREVALTEYRFAATLAVRDSSSGNLLALFRIGVRRRGFDAAGRG